MKNIIPFTKFRFIMFIVSICVLVGFGVGTFLQGGFNSGIDFVGGWNITVQFVPVAFTIDYSGENKYEITILDNKLTIYDVIGDIKKQAGEPLSFNNYDTIGDLAAELERIVPGTSVNILDQFIRLSPLHIISKDAGLPLHQEAAIRVHVPVQSKEKLFTTIDSVREALSPIGNVSVQSIGADPLDQMYILKVKEEDIVSTSSVGEDLLSGEENKVETIETNIKESLQAAHFELETILIKSSEFVGPSFSQELRIGALGSVVVAIILILLYITIRFRIGYALAAITALVHDVCIMLVVIGTLQLELTSATLAAVLTIIGYSLNDTIVVFDRIRENMSLLREQDRETIINTSVTQSLSRTLITSITTLLGVVSIFIFTTGVIKDFAFNLIIGIVVGTYSSIFIASPVLLGWQNVMVKRKKARQEAAVASAKKKTSTKTQNDTPMPKKEKKVETTIEGGKTDTSLSQTTSLKKPRKKKKKKKKK